MFVSIEASIEASIESLGCVSDGIFEISWLSRLGTYPQWLERLTADQQVPGSTQGRSVKAGRGGHSAIMSVSK